MILPKLINRFISPSSLLPVYFILTKADLLKSSIFPSHQTAFTYKFPPLFQQNALPLTCVLLNQMICIMFSSYLTSQQIQHNLEHIQFGTLPPLSWFLLHKILLIFLPPFWLFIPNLLSHQILKHCTVHLGSTRSVHTLPVNPPLCWWLLNLWVQPKSSSWIPKLCLFIYLMSSHVGVFQVFKM